MNQIKFSAHKIKLFVFLLFSILLLLNGGLGLVSAQNNNLEEVQATYFKRCNNAPFIWPTHGKRGWIWNQASSSGGGSHDGFDIWQVNNTPGVEPIYAVYDGWLTAKSSNRFYIKVDIDSSYDVPHSTVYVYYTHMADLAGNSYVLPKFQQIGNPVWVRQGEFLGYQGNYGADNDIVHLHISVSTQANELDYNIDPTKYFGDEDLSYPAPHADTKQVPSFICKDGIGEYGGLEGIVRTASGVPIPNDAYLEIIKQGKTYSTFSGANGYYSFSSLPVGPVTLKAVDTNNNAVIINNINIPANLSKYLDIRLTNTCTDGSALLTESLINTQDEISPVNDCTPIQYPQSPCQNKNNGLYCGSTLGLNTSTLYRCNNGVSSTAQVCANGCSVQPQGTDDFCSPPPSTGQCPNGQNGKYCGSALGLNANTLYNCVDGNKTQIQVCSLGCLQKPPGTDDVCKTSTGGGTCPSGNGDYCGTTLGLDPSTLYTCTNGNIVQKQVCTNGCQLKPPGTPDACYASGGGGGSTGEKVKLFGNSNYDANSLRIQVGAGTTDEPTRGSHYKSMSIPTGWSVILSDQHSGLVGNTQCFNQSIPNLESYGGWYNSIESMKVFSSNVCPTSGGDFVKICRQTGYWGDHAGNCMDVIQNIPDLGAQGYGDNNVKGLHIDGNWEVVLFENPNYGGKKFQTDSDFSDIRTDTGFEYGTSSIQIRKKGPEAVTLFKLGDRNGSVKISSDRTLENLSHWLTKDVSGETWDNTAQSMSVGSGYEVVVCTDPNFRGTCGRTKNSYNNLNDLAPGLRNGVSSVQVCVGSCPPTSVVPQRVSPVDNETFIPSTPVTLAWSGNGEQYYIELWGGALGSIQDSGWITGTAWTRTNLAASTNAYSWRIKSWSSVGETAWSPTFSFKVQDVAPSNVYIDGATQAPLNTDQKYTAFISPSNSANVTYTWSPTPKSGQGTKTATYNWNSGMQQNISVTVQNSGGSKTGSLQVNIGCTQYLATYFNSNNLSGQPVAYECVNSINNDWGSGSPHANVSADNFSVRWTGSINFETTGIYNFEIYADDGMRVYLDNASSPQIDWIVSTTTPLNITGGVHPIKIEYREFTGNAVAQINITKKSSEPPILSTIPGQTITLGQSFNAINLNSYVTNLPQQSGIYWQASGNQNIQVSIVNNVATLTPNSGWTGAENITFTVKNSSNQTASRSAQFEVKPQVTNCPVGKYLAQYYNNKTLSGDPVLVRCENKIRQDWGTGSPHPSIQADNFSVRWTGTLQVPSRAKYKFISRSDDGARLYVDNALQIDNWSSPVFKKSKNLTLKKGKHKIVFEYYEAGGNASARLNIRKL